MQHPHFLDITLLNHWLERLVPGYAAQTTGGLRQIPLSHPLGNRTNNYDMDYQWNWHVCPQTNILFCKHNGQWLAFSPIWQQPTHIVYHLNASCTAFPLNTVPVTLVLFSTSIKVPLPISSMINNTANQHFPWSDKHLHSHSTLCLGDIAMARHPATCTHGLSTSSPDQEPVHPALWVMQQYDIMTMLHVHGQYGQRPHHGVEKDTSQVLWWICTLD